MREPHSIIALNFAQSRLLSGNWEKVWARLAMEAPRKATVTRPLYSPTHPWLRLGGQVVKPRSTPSPHRNLSTLCIIGSTLEFHRRGILGPADA